MLPNAAELKQMIMSFRILELQSLLSKFSLLPDRNERIYSISPSTSSETLFLFRCFSLTFIHEKVSPEKKNSVESPNSFSAPSLFSKTLTRKSISRSKSCTKTKSKSRLPREGTQITALVMSFLVARFSLS